VHLTAQQLNMVRYFNMGRPMSTSSPLQILSLLTVSASFSYKPSLEVDHPEATQGQISYEFGNFGK
jgi:hypothetical protein